MSSGGSGKGGSSKTTQTNFADFQRPGLNRVFDVLSGGAGEDIILGGLGEDVLAGGGGRDSLLQVPPIASDSLFDALSFSRSLINGGSSSESELRNFESLINDEIGGKPFESTIDDIEDLRDAIEARFDRLAGTDPRAGELLLETARGDFLGSNPFVDRLVGDVTTDVSNAVKDNFIAAGGLEASAAPQAIARESGRVANEIRFNVHEAERGRQETAKSNLATFDINLANQELEKLKSSFDRQLGAQSQINQLTQADVARRLNLIGARGNVATQLANLPLAGLNSVGPLAQSFIEQPFIPLANFAEIASLPLQSTAKSSTSSSPLSSLSSATSLALLGAGVGGELGLFGDLTGAAGGSPDLIPGPGLSLFA